MEVSSATGQASSNALVVTVGDSTGDTDLYRLKFDLYPIGGGASKDLQKGLLRSKQWRHNKQAIVCKTQFRSP